MITLRTIYNIDILEITASNRANVCTYAVMGGVELDQPGFIVEVAGVKGSKSKTIVVCASCARAMRGQHKIQRVKNNRDFVCAMGTGEFFVCGSKPTTGLALD